MRTIVLCCAIAVLGCKGKSNDKPAAPAGSGSQAAPLPVAPAAPPPMAPPAVGRPAGVTAEMEATLDKMVVAYEKMSDALANAGTDCKKAAAQVNSIAKDPSFAAMSNMKFPEDDPAFRTWFEGRYEPRLAAGFDKYIKTIEACEDDPDFKAAAEKLNAPFGE